MDVPIKYPYVGGTRWNFLTWADIPDAANPDRVYLRRLRILQTPWFALYLHFIFLPDEDRDPHDHPFPFWSMIVRGGYTETIWRVVSLNGLRGISHDSRTQTWRRGSIHKTPLDRAHMITILAPGTITLVFCGPKVQEWGFYPDSKFKDWQAYNKAKFSEPF